MFSTITAIVADYSFICGMLCLLPVALFAMGMVDEFFSKSDNHASDRKIAERWTTE